MRLNAFFSKNDVRCAKTRYFALKARFMAHYRFLRNESTGNGANELTLKQAFPCV